MAVLALVSLPATTPAHATSARPPTNDGFGGSGGGGAKGGGSSPLGTGGSGANGVNPGDGGGGGGAPGGQGGDGANDSTGVGGGTGGAGGGTPAAAGASGGNSTTPMAGGGGGGGGANAVTGSLSDLGTGVLIGGAGGTGGMGANGGGGGGGGFGAVITGISGVNATIPNAEIVGGGGGGGGFGAKISGGDAGNGGGGLLLQGLSGSNQITMSSAITGGRGGAGGTSYGSTSESHGGHGGDGGVGLTVNSVTGDTLIILSQKVAGGNGGAGGAIGGAGGTSSTGDGGDGGDGIAVFNNTGSVTLLVQKEVYGGNGGASGGVFNGVPTQDLTIGTPGSGGVGISGANIAVILAGSNASVSGGLGGDGTTRADAIAFTGGVNSLELQASSGGVLPTITGAISHAGTDDTLKLGGTNDATFQVSGLDAGGQYNGFGTVQKTGTSTWTLSGTTTGAVTWDIHGGTLSVSADEAFGDAANKLILSGGTLATTASFTSARAVDLQSSSTIDTAAATTLSLSGVISGDGKLTKKDSGTLILTGANTYKGGTAINGGTLQVSSDANLGDASGGLFMSGGTLATTQSFTSARNVTFMGGGGGFFNTAAGTTLTLTGNVTGTSSSSPLTKLGDGTLELTGTNSSLRGGLTVDGGTLAIANGGSITTGAGIIGNSVGSSGTVTVAGQGSSWATTSSRITVGGSGTGTLAISDGGQVSGSSVTVGQNSGSTGTVTVTGADSLWTVFGSITVGGQGTGTVTVADGGTVTTTAPLYLTSASTSVGTLNLDGTDGARGTLETSRIVRQEGSTATLNFDGGVLRATANQADFLSGFAAGEIQIQDGGAFIDTNGYNVGIATGLAGTGGLSKQGDGTLTLSGVSTYTGATTISAGTLALVGVGSIAASSGVAVNGTLDISGTTAGAQIQNLSGTSPSGVVALGSQTLSVEETTNTLYAGTFTGTGDLTKAGAGTLTLTADNSAFTGTTSVLSGMLTVSSENGTTAGLLGGDINVATGATLQVEGGTLTGQVTVGDGGLLDGNGTVGALEVNSGGVVAPGNSPGTIVVNGPVSFNAGSVYQVDVTPAGAHDLITATGAVTISSDAAVNVVAAPGVYAPESTYAILTTEATVSGTFGSVTSDYAFLTPTLSYDTQNVFLTLDYNGVSFTALAQTPNERSTAAQAEALGSGNSVYDAILQLPQDAVAGAFDALSGEVYASADTVIQQQSVYVRDAVGARLRQSVTAPAAQPLAYATKGPATAKLGEGLTPTLWAQGYGGWGNTFGDGNAASLSNTIGGFLIGADVAVMDNARAGVFGGYSRSTFDVDARSSSGSMDNYDVGFYAGAQFGAVAARGGLAYAWHDVSVDRNVVFPGFLEAVSGGYTNGSLQVFGELGYDMTFGAFDIEPFAGLAYLNIEGASFRETGGAAARDASLSSMNTAYTTLGVRAATSLDVFGHQLTPSVTLGWQHAFGDTTPSALMSFVGGTLPLQVSGVPVAEDTFLVEAGLGYALSNVARLSINYSGQVATTAAQNAFTAQFSMKF